MFDAEKHSIVEKVLQTQKRQSRIPIWFMRQAGRYLPEYHKVMHNIEDFFQACYTPEIVKELTLQPIRRFDLDAAIIFSDIMVIPEAMGYDVEFIRGQGPKINERLEQNSTEKALEKLSPVFKGIKAVRQSLEKAKALIGFAGGPWTVATYIVGKENNFFKIRKEYHSETEKIHQLVEEITHLTSQYIIKQIESGASVIQIFDSNACLLPVEMFDTLVLEPTRKIISLVKKQYPNIPFIGFPKGAGVMYKKYAEKTGISATSVDYSIPLSWVKQNIKGAVQGNLDPFLLAYNGEHAEMYTRRIVEELADKPLIFNLGHGILPETPIENLERVINCVRTITP